MHAFVVFCALFCEYCQGLGHVLKFKLYICIGHIPPTYEWIYISIGGIVAPSGADLGNVHSQEYVQIF